jgi:hypothetical protein
VPREKWVNAFFIYSRRSGARCMQSAMRFSCSGIRLGSLAAAKQAFFQDSLDLGQGLVLNLTDTLFGDANDGANFFKRQRRFLLLLPVKPATDHRLLNIGQVGQVAVDDQFQFINTFLFNGFMPTVGPVALLKVRFKFDREPSAMT